MDWSGHDGVGLKVAREISVEGKTEARVTVEQNKNYMKRGKDVEKTQGGDDSRGSAVKQGRGTL